MKDNPEVKTENTLLEPRTLLLSFLFCLGVSIPSMTAMLMQSEISKDQYKKLDAVIVNAKKDKGAEILNAYNSCATEQSKKVSQVCYYKIINLTKDS